MNVAIPFSSPFALIALVPLFYATRAGSWRTAAGGTAAVVAAVASQSLIWGSDQPLAAYVATRGTVAHRGRARPLQRHAAPSRHP